MNAERFGCLIYHGVCLCVNQPAGAGRSMRSAGSTDSLPLFVPCPPLGRSRLGQPAGVVAAQQRIGVVVVIINASDPLPDCLFGEPGVQPQRDIGQGGTQRFAHAPDRS